MKERKNKLLWSLLENSKNGGGLIKELISLGENYNQKILEPLQYTHNTVLLVALPINCRLLASRSRYYVYLKYNIYDIPGRLH